LSASPPNSKESTRIGSVVGIETAFVRILACTEPFQPDFIS